MNNQIDLFRAVRDDGIRRAVTHADEAEPGWSDRAIELLTLFAHERVTFTTHDLRAWAKRKYRFVGTTNWAWGSVIVRARRAGIIKQIGTARVGDTVSHLKLSPVWGRA